MGLLDTVNELTERKRQAKFIVHEAQFQGSLVKAKLDQQQTQPQSKNQDAAPVKAGDDSIQTGQNFSSQISSNPTTEQKV